MKRIVFLILFVVISANSILSQSQDFDFKYIDDDRIEYDFLKYTIDINAFKTPDSSYICEVVNSRGTSAVSRCDRKGHYLFPLKIYFKDSVLLMTFSCAGLYDLAIRDEVNDLDIVNFDSKLTDLLLSNDTLVIDKVPGVLVGSANYMTLNNVDPEFVLFRCDRWLFLNYFFRMSESGLQYEYIGSDGQIPAVVLQLYSWNIKVSDGCGGDQHSTIYIEAYNYPKGITFEIGSDISWIKTWMREFKNKHIVTNRLIDRTEWEMWKNEWWNEL